MATTRKHRSKAEKLSAVLAAEMTGVVAAEKSTGIPESTIRYWMEQPEYAEYRAKAREDLREEITVVAHLAWQRVAEGLKANDFEPRDVLFAAERATTQYLLMSGEATSRTETRSVTDDLGDDEKERLRNWIDSLPATDLVPASDPV